MTNFRDLDDTGNVVVPEDLLEQTKMKTAKRLKRQRIIAGALSAAIVLAFAGTAFGISGGDSLNAAHHGRHHRHHHHHVVVTTTTIATTATTATTTPIVVSPADVENSTTTTDPKVDDNKFHNCDGKRGDDPRVYSFDGDRDGWHTSYNKYSGFNYNGGHRHGRR
jgi:hypothetical protein